MLYIGALKKLSWKAASIQLRTRASIFRDHRSLRSHFWLRAEFTQLNETHSDFSCLHTIFTRLHIPSRIVAQLLFRISERSAEEARFASGACAASALVTREHIWTANVQTRAKEKRARTEAELLAICAASKMHKGWEDVGRRLRYNSGDRAGPIRIRPRNKNPDIL